MNKTKWVKGEFVAGILPSKSIGRRSWRMLAEKSVKVVDDAILRLIGGQK